MHVNDLFEQTLIALEASAERHDCALGGRGEKFNSYRSELLVNFSFHPKELYFGGNSPLTFVEHSG